MKRRTLIPVFLLAFALLNACGPADQPDLPETEEAPQTEQMEAVFAEPVPGWDGVNNVFRNNRMYFAGQPDSAAFVRFAQEAGIGTVVNIRHPEELESLPFDEPALIRGLGMNYVNIPFTPETLSESDIDSLGALLAHEDGPVLIHCGSANRVGGFWAAHLAINEGLSIEEALERGRAAGLTAETMEEAVRRVVGEGRQQ